MDKIKTKIRDIPDFPKPGILFKDITPLLNDPATMQLAVESLIAPFKASDITAIAGMEARGFIFGSLAARELNVGFIPLRKPGKLPYDVESVTYSLEYGDATLEVHVDAIKAGDRILIIDDVLATGGTANASCQLIKKLGGHVVACGFLIELSMLNGRDKLTNIPIHSLITY